MQVILLPLDSITRYVNNPRDNDAAVDVVAASLKEFGWQQAIVLDADRVIIAGDTRYLAARKLGWTEAPCKIADELTPAQVKAYRLADNKTGETAVWNDDKLRIELEAIESLGGSLESTAFSTDEIAKLLALDDDSLAETVTALDEDLEVPAAFTEYDETLETEHECPKCGYKFSGGKTTQIKAAADAAEDEDDSLEDAAA